MTIRARYRRDKRKRQAWQDAVLRVHQPELEREEEMPELVGTRADRWAPKPVQDYMALLRLLAVETDPHWRRIYESMRLELQLAYAVAMRRAPAKSEGWHRKESA